VSSSLTANDIELPVLGDAASGMISKQQEYELGRIWLKIFRSRVRAYDDPLMQIYLEQLLYNLATYSDLEDPRLELVIVKNPSMNAFAVPGGVVGFHTGVFAFAENEDQMASVLAHELAHLSQRHFSRGTEAQKKNSMITMAGLLATVVLAATAGGDAASAAMITSQALSMDNQLRYSRSNEQEADRVGLSTMENANRDPGAVADMFATLLKGTRFNGSRPPEFLLTHPITEKRIGDARSRSMGTSMRQYAQNPEFYLMRARALVAMDQTTAISINRFKGEIEANTLKADAAHYGLALAYLKANKLTEARQAMTGLLQTQPNNLIFLYTDIEIDLAGKQYARAINRLNRELVVNQNNYPLMVLKSETLWQARRYDAADNILTALSRMRPQDPMIWYRLAEVRGLAGNISGLHQARAEYFILVGVFDKARDQLRLAAGIVKEDFKQSAIIRQRLRDLAAMEDRAEKL
jgi:predicted Zn-dependent protease|tara:strand:+ start:1163 stop:2560 length:1398 start_codon:yes stop_codon:yes gene_type:complete